MIQPLWRTVCRFLKKLKIEIPYDPAIPLLGIYPEKTIIQKESCTPMFIAALFTIARTRKQPKCPLHVLTSNCKQFLEVKTPHFHLSHQLPKSFLRFIKYGTGSES